MAHTMWKSWLNILSWMKKLNENSTYKSGVHNINIWGRNNEKT